MKCGACDAEIESEAPEAEGWMRFEVSMFDGRHWRRQDQTIACSLSCAREYLLAQLHAVGEVTQDLLETADVVAGVQRLHCVPGATRCGARPTRGAGASSRPGAKDAAGGSYGVSE